MRREIILIIWIGGLVLAAVLYAIGPDQVLDACVNAVNAIDDAVRLLVSTLGDQAMAVVRALAIALYVVFAVLSFLASQRGQRGIGALLLMTIVLAALIWRPYAVYPAPFSHWAVALALVLVGGIVMTQRLLIPPSRGHGPWASNMPPNMPQGAPPGTPRGRAQ